MKYLVLCLSLLSCVGVQSSEQAIVLHFDDSEEHVQDCMIFPSIDLLRFWITDKDGVCIGWREHGTAHKLSSHFKVLSYEGTLPEQCRLSETFGFDFKSCHLVETQPFEILPSSRF